MKKHLLLISLALIGLTAKAQIPTGYYSSADDKTGDALKVALHDIIHDHTNIGYAAIWSAFYSTDHRSDDVTKVWDMYSDIPNGTPPYVYILGDSQCGSYQNEGGCYNREHSWPQSWFGDKNAPKCDMHHIYPTDGKVNAQRSNYPYGEVKKASWTSQNGSKLGTPKTELGYSGDKVFEPIDEYKGDIARGLFYMSVCYYNDDDGWGTSGMTNKSTILPWAMTMLLNWSDNDPVSQKEIDRNNAVYEVQGNRNPFIDHPEYARMIWDPDYTPTTPHNITYASNLSNGSVSGPSSANEGSTVAIIATPNAGYQVSSYSVYKTGNQSTTVAVSSNGTFTMPDYEVTVSATFVQNTQQYTITKGNISNGDITISATTALSGTTVTLTATPDNGYSLYSWYVFKTGDMNNTVAVDGNSFVMPTFNVTVSASFVQPSSYSYVKVTEAPTDWSGEYLIVCESQGVAFNGTIDSKWGRCSSVSIVNNTIASNEVNDNYVVTVSPQGTGYKFLFHDNKYMNWTTAKNFSEGTSAEAYSITLSNGNAQIAYGTTATLKYNHNNGEGGLRSYASGQTEVQLYKKTATVSAPTHTIQFNPNGNSQSSYTQTVNEFELTTLNPCTFTYVDHSFDGWNTKADGSGDYYDDEANVRLLADITLYAQWEPLYSITISNAIEHGSVTANVSQAFEEQTVTLTATPESGYEFDHWLVTDASNNPVSVTDNQFEMPASNVTVNATFAFVGQPFTQKYYLVTSIDQLEAGRTYLIVNTTAGKALSTTQNNNNRGAVDVTISNNVIESIESTVCKLTLGGSTDAWTFYDGNKSGYLYAASSNNNYLKTQTNNDANGQWSIAITQDGTATIVSQGSNTRNNLRYNPNSGSPIFSCYASTSDLAKVELFIQSEENEYTSNTTLACLNSFDKSIIRSGVTVTANSVLGINQTTDPSLVIIEEGGQLIHQATGLEATLKKSIQAYSNGESDGWYTIAVPFTEFTPSQVATDNYDLYAYDEDAAAEWINFKSETPFPTATATGYLYAHSPSTTLRMEGTLNSGSYSETVNLSYGNTHADIKGYNLLGNPTAHDITFSKTDNVSDGYYYLNNSENWVYETGNSVPVGRGFLVKADASNQSVTLNPQSKDSRNVKEEYLAIDIDGEKAYVKLNEGVSMPLLSFRDHHSSLWLENDGQSYVMLVRDNANSIELNYKAQRPGLHLLNVDAKGLDLGYLHLIDRLTGADIDLLATPSYTFKDHSSDYASRFQLVFADNGTDTGDDFAFISNGELVVNGTGTVVAVDMLGRTVFTHEVHSALRTPHSAFPAPGVYVLRLITPEKVRTQKLIIH